MDSKNKKVEEFKGMVTNRTAGPICDMGEIGDVAVSPDTLQALIEAREELCMNNALGKEVSNGEN